MLADSSATKFSIRSDVAICYRPVRQNRNLSFRTERAVHHRMGIGADRFEVTYRIDHVLFPYFRFRHTTPRRRPHLALLAQRIRRTLLHAAAYVWAAPNSALGAIAGLAVLCLGGRLRFVSGAAEFHGGLAGRCFAGLPAPLRFNAMTLGHVILGVGPAELSLVREHEQVHVRQYEKWGLLFLPAYALSSGRQLVRGRSPYRDLFFERQAYAADARTRSMRAPASVDGPS